MIVQLLDPKMDFIFKKIFGNEQEKSVLLSFLNLAIKPINPIIDVELRNVEIKKAKEELYKISADEDERELYRIREKAYLDELSALAEAEAKGIEKGLEKGREEGEKNKALAIAVSLIGLLPDELIAEKTGLQLEDIQKLKK